MKAPPSFGRSYISWTVGGPPLSGSSYTADGDGLALVDPIDSTPLPTPEEDQDNKPTKAMRVFSYACKIAYPEEAAHVEYQLTLTHRHRNLLTDTRPLW